MLKEKVSSHRWDVCNTALKRTDTAPYKSKKQGTKLWTFETECNNTPPPPHPPLGNLVSGPCCPPRGEMSPHAFNSSSPGRNDHPIADDIFRCIFGTSRRWFNHGYKYIGVSYYHWDRVTHIFVNKVTVIGSDNGLSPGRCEAIIWNNGRLSLIGPLGTNFSEIVIEIKEYH